MRLLLNLLVSILLILLSPLLLWWIAKDLWTTGNLDY